MKALSRKKCIITLIGVLCLGRSLLAIQVWIRVSNTLSSSSRQTNTNAVQLPEAQGLNEELADLHQLAQATSRLYARAGTGVDTSEGLESLLKSQEGHCGHFVYMFGRRLTHLGYPFRIYGTRTSVELGHALVEVNVRNKWYLFDPSNGVYYPHSYHDMLGSPARVEDRVGDVSELYSAYSRPSFFANITRYYSFTDLDRYETDVALKAELCSSSEFYPNHGPENALDGDATDDYVAAVENSFPNTFAIKLRRQEKIYRISITWFDGQNYASDFEIHAVIDGRYEEVFVEKHYTTGRIKDQIILDEPITTDAVKLVVHGAKGQKRLLLRQFQLFRY